MEDQEDQRAAIKFIQEQNIITDEKLHFIPFDIKKKGQANVDGFFNCSIQQEENKSEKDENPLEIQNILSNCLYGRKLYGQKNELQEKDGLNMLVFQKQKVGVMNEKDLTLTHKLDNFYNWENDQKPSITDRNNKNIVYIQALNCFHNDD